MTKEEVFGIMGKYYGNAYYRTAIEQNISERDLRLIADMLDEINAFGYHFSNTHRLTEIDCVNFVPIILSYFQQIYALNLRIELLLAVRFPSYEMFVPDLINIYEASSIREIKVAASEAIMSIRSRKYISEYLRIMESPGYGRYHDWIIETLCKMRVQAVLPRLLFLLQKYPKVWEYTFLKYAASFRDVSLIPIVSNFLDSSEPEKRRLARKTVDTLTKRNTSV